MLPEEPVPAPPADSAPAGGGPAYPPGHYPPRGGGERLHDSRGVARRGHPAPPEDPFPASVSWETVPSDGALIFLPSNAKEVEGPPGRHRYQMRYPPSPPLGFGPVPGDIDYEGGQPVQVLFVVVACGSETSLDVSPHLALHVRIGWPINHAQVAFQLYFHVEG